MTGIDPALIVGEFNPIFLCKICKMVVKNPLECRECGSLYCSSCTLKTSSQCPTDRAELCPLNQFLARIYNSLMIKNPYENDEVITISAYTQYLIQQNSKKKDSLIDLKVRLEDKADSKGRRVPVESRRLHASVGGQEVPERPGKSLRLAGKILERRARTLHQLK